MHQFWKNMMKKLLNAKFFLLNQLLTLLAPETKQMEKRRLHSLIKMFQDAIQFCKKYDENPIECQIFLLNQLLTLPMPETADGSERRSRLLDENVLCNDALSSGKIHLKKNY
ncbi:hypothetical protein AVEN_17347-1 [Araneus ventricosus]|uniref:Uncharacterized protein n=1 Tax=Araneus ventricosus TaxID=182803 RepID=A0A4Y2VID7_ARAVE|nr:hypothetical protein AVEN_17347-1 [Araneus ventricosus]